MTYLKVWTSFLELIKTLEYDEVGRLFEMMLVYAESGNEPETFDGNERFLWPVAKQQIDLAAMKNEILRQNGMRGGRPKAEETKENQTEPNETKENQTKAYKEKKSKEKECKEKELLSVFDGFWAEYPKKVARKDAVKAWERLSPDDGTVQQIMAGLQKWKNSDEWTRDDGRYIPHPATWLNGRRWEDEVTPRRSGGYEQRDYHDVQDDMMRRQNERIIERLALAAGAEAIKPSGRV